MVLPSALQGHAAGAKELLAAVSKDPSLLDDLRYPPDSYGNNCGKPSTVTNDTKKVRAGTAPAPPPPLC